MTKFRILGPVLCFTALSCVFSRAAGVEYHVSPLGNDQHSGSPSEMLRTISEAAERALPGDVITVHAGVYRERIDPPRGGLNDNQRITYRAATGAEVVIKGSEAVQEPWTYLNDDTWSVLLPNSFFGGFNPFNRLIEGDWLFTQDRSHHSAAVYLDGHWLNPAATKDEVLGPVAGEPSWFAEVDGGGYLMNIGTVRVQSKSGLVAEIEADSFSNDDGIITATSSEGEDCLSFIEDGDWVAYEGIDFGLGADRIDVRASSPVVGGIVEFRLGGSNGELLGIGEIEPTGGWQSWQTFSAEIELTGGVHDLYLVFRSIYADDGYTTIWAQFPGVDPNDSLVEVNTRPTVFYPEAPGINFITVRGFTMEHAATPWAPPTAEQIGLIGTHWSKGWIIENNTIRYSACSGVTLGKYGDRWDNRADAAPDGAIFYVSTINRALEDGWDRESIGHHLVRNNRIYNCEQAGIVGSMGGAFSTIKGNLIYDIHVRRHFGGYEQAGIKLHGGIDVILDNNYIANTPRGIWLDWMSQGARVTRNVLEDNTRHDLFLEVNHGPLLVDHNILMSDVAVTDRSTSTAFVHNLIAGSFDVNPDNRRRTPYHEAHSTMIAGLNKHPGGDNHFYNNIFIGPASTSLYSQSFHPNSMDGNVYLNRSRAAPLESDPITEFGFNPMAQLRVNENGQLLFEMDIDFSWSEERSRSVVTSDMLGLAIIPGVPFEKPDQSDYWLGVDMLGVTRSTGDPFPGPFEVAQGGRLVWQVFPIQISRSIEASVSVVDGEFFLTWQSAQGAAYDVYTTSYDGSGFVWIPWHTNMQATPPVNQLNISIESAETQLFLVIMR